MSCAQWPKRLVTLKNSSLSRELLADSAGAKFAVCSSREHEDASLKVVMTQPSYRKVPSTGKEGRASESHMLPTAGCNAPDNPRATRGGVSLVYL